MKSIFDDFDAWEPLFKARKAKGLDKWDRLKNISEKLQGKDVKAISFTCAHPSHGGKPVRHLLGSVEGNLHFLLGYGNPRFHLAPYHWQVIDPNTTDEEAEEIFKRMRHPANPVLWQKAEIDADDEGDLDEGKPHKAAIAAKAKKAAEQQRQKEAIKAVTPTGTYTAYPSEGIVVGGPGDRNVYRWDLVKDTFFTAQNPKLADEMNARSIEKGLNSVVFRASVPYAVRQRASAHRGDRFYPDVWPLIKSRVPAPGTVVNLTTTEAERIYGVVTPSSLEFYDQSGSPVDVKVFDQMYKSFDLTVDGDTPPAVLLSFVVKQFKVNPSLLAAGISDNEITLSKAIHSIEGQPSTGWEDAPEEYDSSAKRIVREGDTIRLVVSQ